MHIHETPLLEKLVHGGCQHGAHAEHRLEHVRPRPQMLDGTQILERVALLLQRIIARAGANDANGIGANLERLRRIRRQAQLALDRNGAAGGDPLAQAARIVFIYDLHGLERRTVRQLNKAHRLALARGAHPTAHLDRAGIPFRPAATAVISTWELPLRPAGPARRARGRI